MFCQRQSIFLSFQALPPPIACRVYVRVKPNCFCFHTPLLLCRYKRHVCRCVNDNFTLLIAPLRSIVCDYLFSESNETNRLEAAYALSSEFSWSSRTQSLIDTIKCP
jgi:hypothetical protein